MQLLSYTDSVILNRLLIKLVFIYVLLNILKNVWPKMYSFCINCLEILPLLFTNFYSDCSLDSSPVLVLMAGIYKVLYKLSRISYKQHSLLEIKQTVSIRSTTTCHMTFHQIRNFTESDTWTGHITEYENLTTEIFRQNLSKICRNLFK